MAIAVDIVVREFPYGNPGSLGEPLGLWVGTALVTGDASGGDIEVRFQPQNPGLTPTLDDQRLQYVWFIDGANISANGVTGNLGCKIEGHMARANAALSPPVQIQSVSLPAADGLHNTSLGTLLPRGVERMPIFWSPVEVSSGGSTIVHLQAQTNTDTVAYQFSAYGRYYDKQILGNRGFGRLIAPAAISQFEG